MKIISEINVTLIQKSYEASRTLRWNLTNMVPINKMTQFLVHRDIFGHTTPVWITILLVAEKLFAVVGSREGTELIFCYS